MTENKLSRYQTAKAMGCTIHNYHSDMYVLLDEPGREFVKAHKPYSTFKSDADGLRYAEYPLAFDPFWESKIKPRSV